MASKPKLKHFLLETVGKKNKNIESEQIWIGFKEEKSEVAHSGSANIKQRKTGADTHYLEVKREFKPENSNLSASIYLTDRPV